MRVKTSELTGAALDCAVCIANGMQPEDLYLAQIGRHQSLYRRLRDDAGRLNGKYVTGPDLLFSQKWEAGGPIIARERISIRTYATPGHNWVAFLDCGGSSVSGARARQTGPTPLVAAMRCYVASKLGDEVELPKGLV